MISTTETPAIKDPAMVLKYHRMLRTFKPDSLLHGYLSSHKQETFSKNLSTYRISTIELALGLIVKIRGMADIRNPVIIICDKELEQVIDLGSFHWPQLRSIIEKHLLPFTGTEPLSSSRLCTLELQALEKFQQDPFESIIPGPEIPPETPCLVDPKFLEVLRSEIKADSPLNLNPISMRKEVGAAMSNYILARKEKLFDLRNIKIALAQDDPIGEVFNVPAFSRSQVSKLINSKLRPIRRSKRLTNHPPKNSGPYGTTVTTLAHSKLTIAIALLSHLSVLLKDRLKEKITQAIDLLSSIPP